MKKIESIESEIQLLEPKLNINASDWTREEKEAIAKAYFEITKVSRTKGLMVDLECGSCVATAVVIINNYRNAVTSVEESKQESDWTKDQASVDAYAAELNFEFPASVKKKKDKIAAIESYLTELSKETEE